MSFLDKILGRPPESDYDDYDDSFEYVEPEPAAALAARRPPQQERDNRVVDLRSGRAEPRHRLVLVEVTMIDNAWTVCDRVMEGKTVICNTENMQQDRQRFQDILSGVSYAIGGVIQKVSQYIFVIAPRFTQIRVEDSNYHNSGEMLRDLVQSEQLDLRGPYER